MLDIKLFRMNAGKDNLDALADVLINNSSSRQKRNTIVTSDDQN